MYDDAPNGLEGNEDCGQMSAWYILSSMGFYSVNPGDAIYNIGSPLFDKVTINLENGKKFVIQSNNVSDKNIYIQSASLNGEFYTKSWFSHEEIANGGEFIFEMGSTPNNNWGTSIEDRPFTGEFLPAVNMPYILDKDENFLEKTTISLRCETDDALIYYTLDGSEPNEKSQIYTMPFEIDKTSILNFKAYKKGLLPSLPVSEKLNELEYEKFQNHKAFPMAAGLEYKYYEGNVMFVKELLDLKIIESDIISHFTIENRKTDSYFGYEYNGFIKIPKDGAYTFYNKTNDGSILYLNNNEFINTDGGHPAHEAYRTIALRKGSYKIDQKYFQMGGGFMNKVSWKGPGIKKTEIPASVLFHKK